MNNHFVTVRYRLAIIFFVLLQAAVAANSQKVYSGYSHTLAIKNDSSLWIWGGNSKGQLGNGATGQIWYPIQVVGQTALIDAAGGFEHSISLKKDGTVWGWGRNSEGQLGDGTVTQRTTPVQVNSLSNILNVGAGYYHSFAVKTDGTLWAVNTLAMETSLNIT